MLSKRSLPYLWMLLAAAAFALMGNLAHALRLSCNWQLIALARAFIPLVTTVVLAHLAGVKLVFWTPLVLWIRSIAGSLSLVCAFFAFTRMPVSDVLTLTNLFPIWVAVLSWPLLNRAPSRAVWFAVATGIFGVVLIQQPHFQNGNLTSLIAVAASFCSAIAMLGLHRLQTVDARAIVVHFSAVSLVFCLAAWFFLKRSGDLPEELSAVTVLMLAGVGLAATIGQLFLTRAFREGDPAKVSVVGLTQVGFGMLLDLVLWGRAFSLLTVAGMLLVTAPTAWLLVNRSQQPVEL